MITYIVSRKEIISESSPCIVDSRRVSNDGETLVVVKEQSINRT